MTLLMTQFVSNVPLDYDRVLSARTFGAFPNRKREKNIFFLQK
jgi:hypothetical protein